jgi:hypothetical protein
MGSSGGEPIKRKEIYTYCADWEIYGMSWTVRPDQRFRFLHPLEFLNKVTGSGRKTIFLPVRCVRISIAAICLLF